MANERRTEVREAPLAYILDVKSNNLKYAKHKFTIGSFSQKKVKIPIFKAGLDKELLLTLREFNNMVTNYRFTNTQPQVDQSYILEPRSAGLPGTPGERYSWTQGLTAEHATRSDSCSTLERFVTCTSVWRHTKIKKNI